MSPTLVIFLFSITWPFRKGNRGKHKLKILSLRKHAYSNHYIENFTTKKWKLPSMFLSRNKKINVYPCKPQFYGTKVGFKGIKTVSVSWLNSMPSKIISNHHFSSYIPLIQMSWQAIWSFTCSFQIYILIPSVPGQLSHAAGQQICQALMFTIQIMQFWKVNSNNNNWPHTSKCRGISIIFLIRNANEYLNMFLWQNMKTIRAQLFKASLA